MTGAEGIFATMRWSVVLVVGEDSDAGRAALAPTFIESQNTDGENCSVRPPITSVVLLQYPPAPAPESFSPPRQ